VSKTGLGKGLSALIPNAGDVLKKEEQIAEIDVNAIVPNSFQPRRVFDEEKLNELAESIKEHGIVQPIIVRRLRNERYELVVGERRLRASKILQKDKIPAVIKDYTNQQMMEIALIENIQRQDLDPIEEAYAYKRLLEEFNLTQEQVAQKVAKSRSFIANMVRILNLPELILNKVSKGELTVGHVRPLLTVSSEAAQIKAAEEMINKDLNVREAEALVKEITADKKRDKAMGKRTKEKLSPELIDIESKLRDACGTKVVIKSKGKKGKIEIDYYNDDDLSRILAIFLQR
jgi:ParB family chromosome partitioning protein